MSNTTTDHPQKQAQLAQMILSIADKYRVDPNDPLFSVLEKMDEYHNEMKQGFITLIPQEIETLKELIQSFQIKANELNQAVLKFSESERFFETNVQTVCESTRGLIRYWEQIHAYYALIGMAITLIICMGGFGVYYYRSADRLLSQVGASLILEPSPSSQNKRLTLTGRKFVDAGKSNSGVVMEFSP